ncbi:VOC family protein [Desulfurivibrio sp. C05AmB]|jgi:catechol 2,3-dioxygenase-like lactoylglutathione lyase family enzyme|uniref:VOC family protein n=1 Tax=Desulfurivibrio sp. C05AmB TaxID=3374371 RepID=UPI00376EC639
MPAPKYAPGRNIAIKVPPHEFDQTVAFYRDVLGFPELEDPASGSTESVRFRFGDKVLWIDRAPAMSQAEIWLEIETADITAAAAHLGQNQIVRCDAIEPLPASFKGFWLTSPANIVHLLSAAKLT